MKVLVVDDQELNRNLLNHMLKHEGFDVILANDGLEAIEKTRTESPDLVLLDVIMPNLDGFETAPRLKELSGEVYLPIIFITALGDQDSLKRCLDVGGDDFLNKPFDRVILKAKIQAHARIRELSIKTYEQKKQLDSYRLQTEREHQIVEHIFSRAIEGNCYIPHLLDLHLSPASMFNGDILLTSIGPTGNLYIMIGDFTGHGLAAAVGTLPVSRTFYSMAQKGLSVGDIANEINSTLWNILPDDMFCAASIIELNHSGKTLSVWAGGTPDMYLLDSSNNSKQTIASQHMALGVMDEDEFDIASDNYNVTPHHSLVAYTDGLVELSNDQDEMYGYERLEALLDDPKQNNMHGIIDSFKEFKGGQEQDDDITLILLKCLKVNTPFEGEPISYSSVPHQFSVTLEPEHIKNSDPVVEIIDMITLLKGAEEHRSTLFLLLSEAYNNALDHGLLKLDSKLKDTEDGFMEFYMERADRLMNLDSGYVDVNIRYSPADTSIYMTVKDSGTGYDPDKNVTTLEGEQEHGRGNLLIQQLASSIVFNPEGNEITLGYQLDITKRPAH